jgi:hypothetical protein
LRVSIKDWRKGVSTEIKGGLSPVVPFTPQVFPDPSVAVCFMGKGLGLGLGLGLRLGLRLGLGLADRVIEDRVRG